MTGFPEEQIEKLAEEKLEGKSYSEIRAGLKNAGIADEEINRLIRQVDARVLETELLGGAMNRPRQWYTAGLVTAIAGLAISIAYNVGLILQGLPSMAVYAPFLAGILLMFYGKMQQRRQSETKVKGPGPIRRQRPYK